MAAQEAIAVAERTTRSKTMITPSIHPPLSDLLRLVDSARAESSPGKKTDSIEVTPSQQKAIEGLSAALQNWFKSFPQLADTKRSCKEAAHSMTTERLAIIQVTVGYATQGADQPLTLCLEPVSKWLPELERTIAEINSEIRKRIPLTGPRNLPTALEQPDEAALYSIGDAIATRTMDRVQLLLVPQDSELTTGLPR